jgi:nitrite reductase/ring-hydroxylating ferredoxin subunit
MADTIQVCTIGDVEEGSALKVEAGDLTLAVFNLNGAFYVIDDQCTHGPGSLSEGYNRSLTAGESIWRGGTMIVPA